MDWTTSLAKLNPAVDLYLLFLSAIPAGLSGMDTGYLPNLVLHRREGYMCVSYRLWSWRRAKDGRKWRIIKNKEKEKAV